jgi:hypothetical protein
MANGDFAKREKKKQKKGNVSMPTTSGAPVFVAPAVIKKDRKEK